MGLIRILIIIILIFYVFSMIIRILFQHKIKKATRQMQQEFTDDYQDTTKKPSNPHVDPNIGEYTDFEEIN